ncbi:MAG: Abi family protein [Lachnospiraceae bacterium]|jgi:hypothetical protein|nr:Abi family protein [Lachnospiraceae bacterium]MBF1002121.1 Abi family protein [Lachnospiraceae bacterium]MBF1004862.1 Abi family protein [Lachnospiraceae bacterium]MBF1009258.1 Abi family protein [Lachnospiraceae bacterium]MBF1012937.1 Abi family protein [Lachnospiraceae bacterium]
MVHLKSALTYEEQVEHLIKVHNLSIHDTEKAVRTLQRVNYYRLSAYGIGLTQKENSEKYRDGISLEHIHRLYKFDSMFRNRLIHVIEHMEIQLRTKISYHLALKFGPEGYMDQTNFLDKKTKSGESVHSIIINNFWKECGHQKNAPFVKHHMHKYEGHFPIWVAVELFTFGNLSSLYSIMKKEDQQVVADLYNTDRKYLGSWILALVEIRNICAHYSRLYNMPLKQTPYLYSEYRKYRRGSMNKIFPVLLVIKRMQDDRDLWKSFEKNLEGLFDEYRDVINLSFIGFPKEWKLVLSE